MKNKIKIFNKIVNVTVFIILAVFIYPLSVRAYNQAEKCVGNVCTLLINDLPDGSGTVSPNTNIQLDFAVYQAGNRNNSNICPAGFPNIYHILKHFSTASNNQNPVYDYRSSGTGEAFSYTFNSGGMGQINNYQAIFFCDSSLIVGTQNNVVDTRLSNLSSNRVFYVTPFEMATAAAPLQATIMFSPLPTKSGNDNYFTLGTRLYLIVANLDPSSVGRSQYTLNGKTLPLMWLNQNGKLVYPLNLTADEGFDVSGADNDLSIDVLSPNGTDINLKDHGIQFKIGTPPGSATTTTTSGTSPSNLPTDKLYNPLPEEELTHMFLFIAKGFLSIVGIWAVIFIIVGGFRMVIAAGDEEALTKAKKTVTWAVIGVIVAALSFSIIAIVQNLLNAKIQ